MSIYDYLKKKIVPSYCVSETVYKICNYDSKRLLKNLIRIVKSIQLEKKMGVCIGKHCTVGEGIMMPHPHNIVIGDNVHIGSNCCIYQGVTIGTSKRYDDKYPIIGNNGIIKVL